MKKLLSLILILAILFSLCSLAACGEKNKEQKVPENEVENTENTETVEEEEIDIETLKASKPNEYVREKVEAGIPVTIAFCGMANGYFTMTQMAGGIGEAMEKEGVIVAKDLKDLYSNSNFVSLHIPATEQTKNSIGYDLLSLMPKGGCLVNTARKEVINEEGLVKALEEREDLKYITDVATANHTAIAEKFGKRVFGTPKKMGAETAEANMNAGLAAASQIVDFFKTGNKKFQVNR